MIVREADNNTRSDRGRHLLRLECDWDVFCFVLNKYKVSNHLVRSWAPFYIVRGYDHIQRFALPLYWGIDIKPTSYGPYYQFFFTLSESFAPTG